MLHRSFLPVVIDCLLKRNKRIVDVACHSTLRDSLDANPKDTKHVNTIEMKKEFEKAKSKRKTREVSVNIVDYVQSINPDIIDICPKQVMKICGKETNILYLIDKNAAAKFVSMIIDDLSKNMCFVAELNPGLGILTTELLKAGVPLIHLYEAKMELHPTLNKLQDIYPGRLDLRAFNLIKISQLLYMDREMDRKQVQEALQAVETTKWEDKTCMQVIGATSTSNFFKHLVYSLLFRNCLMSCGRPVFYIAVPPSLWYKYSCDNSDHNLYTNKKVIFQTMFDYKLLGTLNRKVFLPWLRRSKKPKHNSLSYQIEQMDYEEISVIRLEPKADVYSHLSQEEWIIFWYFLRHNMRKRCGRVIPELEKWIPGCGVRLIAKDYTIFTQFGDLSPERLLELFKEFKSWPEYKSCSFLTSMNNALNTYNEPALLELDKMQDE